MHRIRLRSARYLFLIICRLMPSITLHTLGIGGAQISEEIDLGNSVNNQGQLSFDGRFNFEQLYNKSKYLQKINKRFSSNNRLRRRRKIENSNVPFCFGKILRLL